MRKKHVRTLTSLALSAVLLVSGLEIPVGASDVAPFRLEAATPQPAGEGGNALPVDTSEGDPTGSAQEQETAENGTSRMTDPSGTGFSETSGSVTSEPKSESEPVKKAPVVVADSAAAKDPAEEDQTEENSVLKAAEIPSPAEPSESWSVFVVNPLYAHLQDSLALEDTPESGDLAPQTSSFAALRSASGTFTTVQDAAKYVREQMVNRVETVSFQVPASLASPGSSFSSFVNDVINTATAYFEGCSGKEGDALRWGYKSYKATMSSSGGTTQVTFTFAYHTTAAQEQELTVKVNEAIASLNLTGKSDYGKARAIHDYICDNVDYDFDGTDETFPERYSAYAALCRGKAVCQGYSILFYRMCREAGLSVRIISGTGNGGAHGWNIVKIDDAKAKTGGVYYNVDCTWDGQYDKTRTHHTYFLKCEADFINHTRASEYNTGAFHAEFPMAGKSYVLAKYMNVDNLANKTMYVYDYVSQTVDYGKEVSTAATEQPKVLIFIQTTCTRSQETVQSLAKETFGDDVDIYVISTDSANTKAENLKNFIQKYASGNNNITFGLQRDNIWNDYFNLAVKYAGWNGNENTPTICYIDANNKVQYMTYGQQTGNAIKTNIETFCRGNSDNITTAFTITYSLDGGTNHTGNPAAYLPDTGAIRLYPPEREGYVFAGWYTDSAMTRQITELSTTAASGDITLYARWKPILSITYELDGGTNHSDNPSTYVPGDPVRLLAPTKAGYVFAGWFTDKKLTQPITELTEANTASLALYAKWEISPAVPAEPGSPAATPELPATGTGTPTAGTGTPTASTGTPATGTRTSLPWGSSASSVIVGENRVAWDDVRARVDTAEKGSVIKIDMGESTVVPGDVFQSIRGKDITITFDMGGGISWSIDGQSITADNIGSIDLSVKTGTNAIPASTVSDIAGDSYCLQISLAHDGEFGFTATLSINLGAEHKGLTAQLYYYNEASGELEPLSTSEIAEDGTAKLVFTHASDYAIVVSQGTGTDKKGASPVATSGTGGEAEDAIQNAQPQQKSGFSWLSTVLIILGLLLVGGGIAFAVRKKKSGK